MNVESVLKEWIYFMENILYLNGEKQDYKQSFFLLWKHVTGYYCFTLLLPLWCLLFKSKIQRKEKKKKILKILSKILVSFLRQVVTRTRFVQLMKFLDSEKNPALINVLWIVLDSDGSDYLGESSKRLGYIQFAPPYCKGLA